MTGSSLRYILASRSPRRRELLALIVRPEQIEIVPPAFATEAGFAGLHDWPAIERRIAEIARAKCADVLRATVAGGTDSGTHDLPEQPHQSPVRLGSPDLQGCVIAADTEIVAADAAGTLHVLGQPPENETWRDVVRKWFREFYAGKSHTAVTALCVARLDGRRIERVVKTTVWFHADAAERVEWYIGTREPRGKAGGYAIQGAGSVFVSAVEGSLSNVIGLPLRELLEMLEELGIPMSPED